MEENPPPYEEIASSRRPSSDLAKSVTISLPSAKSNRIAPLRNNPNPNQDHCFGFSQMKHFMDKRPVMKLFLVIIVNGLVSMVFAAIFIGKK